MDRRGKGFNPTEHSSGNYQKNQREAELWEVAAKISQQLTDLEARSVALYAEVEKLRSSGSIIGADKDYNDKIKEYWTTMEEINLARAKENRLQTVIEKVSAATATDEDISEFLDDKKSNAEQPISKRRRAILKEADRMRRISGDRGYLDSDLITDSRGRETTRLTTGRNASAVKGVTITSESALGEFLHRTADTHGGKVGHGKNPGSYTSASGKRVRKK